MPKVKRSRKPPPEGWELIEPTIDELDAKMREGIVIVSMFCICSVKSADFYSDFSQVYGSIVLLTQVLLFRSIFIGWLVFTFLGVCLV